MSEEAKPRLRDERERRRRINRIKKGIITFLITYLIVTLIIIICLSVSLVITKKENKALKESSETVDFNKDDKKLSLSDDSDNLAKKAEEHKVYLTFEDGPSENTNKILDILNQYNVKATFFVTGTDDADMIAVYKRIVDEGHTIGMHSYSHKYSSIYDSPKAFEDDLNQISSTIEDATGIVPKYYRFVGGSNNKISNTKMSDLISILNKRNISYVDWNVSSGDATKSAFTKDDLVENVMRDVVKYKTSVVLLHDGENNNTTVDALPQLIESLQQDNIQLNAIDDNTYLVRQVTVNNK